MPAATRATPDDARLPQEPIAAIKAREPLFAFAKRVLPIFGRDTSILVQDSESSDSICPNGLAGPSGRWLGPDANSKWVPNFRSAVL